MTGVDQLHRKYPNLPREIIIKWEVLNQGIRDTAALDKVSRWTRGGSYQSRDLDVSIKDVAEKRPGTAKPGYVMRPKVMYMKNGIGANVQRHSRTPYEVREEREGQFALYEGEQKVEDVYFLSPKGWGEELVTSKGTPVPTIVTPQGRCFRIQPIRFCEYFTRGEQCKFCNYNATYEQARAAGANIPITIDLEDTVEAYKIISSEVRLIEGAWQSGALTNSETEAALQIRFVDRIANAAPYTPNMRMSVPPLDRKEMQRLRDAGLTCFETNVEVWDADLFEEVCPGKAKHRSFERYKEVYLEAVDIFGVGNVACAFVAGVSLMPYNGHKTWQDSRDALIEGFRWLVDNGVFPCFLPIRLGVGSVYGDDKANWQKVPPTEFYLDLVVAHNDLLLEHGVLEKLNRLMFCPLDCPPGACCGELGMVTMAGDMGKWSASCFPEDANWIGHLVESLRSPTDTK